LYLGPPSSPVNTLPGLGCPQPSPGPSYPRKGGQGREGDSGGQGAAPIRAACPASGADALPEGFQRTAILAYLEDLGKDVTTKFAELDKLSHELETMKALHEENTTSLKDKIAFINKKSIWWSILTHTVAFLLGILGSVTANYIYDYLRSLKY
jgi:hypothetical protein